MQLFPVVKVLFVIVTTVCTFLTLQSELETSTLILATDHSKIYLTVAFSSENAVYFKDNVFTAHLRHAVLLI